MSVLRKSPDEILDYTVDWSDWLQAGDAITAVTWIVPAGLTLVAQDHDDTSDTAWIAGGQVGERHRVICRITTAGGRTAERALLIRIVTPRTA